MRIFLSKNFILYTCLLLVAVVSGAVIGDLYVSMLPASLDMSALSESELRGDQDIIASLYQDAVNGRKSSFTAVELYQIAEYKLNNTSRYVKVMTGNVHNSVTGDQSMRSNKLVTANTMVYQKISPSSGGPAPTISSRIVYEDNTITLNKKGTIKGNNVDNFSIDFDNSNDFIMSEEEYKKNFNTNVTTALPYIVSNYTCAEGNYDKNIRLGSDRTYKFNISMSGTYLSLAAYYYSYEIRYFSGFDVLPSWKNLKMEVVVDENFNFLSIHYVEDYSMLIFINAAVTDDFTDKFYYDEETVEKFENELCKQEVA